MCFLSIPRFQSAMPRQGDLENYHDAESIWSASGARKLRARKDLYDHGQKTVRPGRLFAPVANYLRRPADIIRPDLALCRDISDLGMSKVAPSGSAPTYRAESSGPVFPT